MTAALPHWSDILLAVQSLSSCEDWSANPHVKNFSLFISVVVYVDTATAWSNDSPVFFLIPPPTNGSCLSLYFFLLLHFIPPTFFPFYFLDLFFFFFLTTASWNRSGWHPRSLTGQCTSHLPLPPLSFSDSLPSLRPLTPCWLPFCLSFKCTFIAPSVLSLTTSHLVSSLHITVPPPSFCLLHSPPTHFFLFFDFKQPSCLTWSESRQLPSGLIDFLLCLSLLNAHCSSNNRLRCVTVGWPALSASSAGQLQVSSRGTWDPEQMRTISPDLHASK